MDRVIKILFLSANPKDTDQRRLDEEMRGIDQALRQAEFRDKFEIKQQWAVRVVDLQGYLLRHKPDIVHFSGYGSSSSKIMLEDKAGNSQPVSSSALGQLFSILRDNIRCVVLNACYSEQQAQAIAKHIDCVIGMSKAIGDSAAISFALAFYQALGFGRDVKTAFDLGCVQINLESLNEQNTPRLLAVNVNANEVVFVKTLSISSNKRIPNPDPIVKGSKADPTDISHLHSESKLGTSGDNEAWDKLVELLGDILKVDKFKISCESNYKEDWDVTSVEAFELVMELEEKFDIKIPKEDARDWITVGDTYQYLLRILDS